VTFDERARDAMAGDVQYACPALAANQLLSRWAPSAFAHEFDDAGAGPLGAMHSAELAYFFNLNLGGPVMGPGSLPTTSQALARTMRGYWASFARSGIPSVSGAATWDPFPRQIQLLVAPSPGSESSVEYSSRHHGAFWQ
jgi:para-nitrobenzyl esterase